VTLLVWRKARKRAYHDKGFLSEACYAIAIMKLEQATANPLAVFSKIFFECTLRRIWLYAPRSESAMFLMLILHLLCRLA